MAIITSVAPLAEVNEAEVGTLIPPAQRELIENLVGNFDWFLEERRSAHVDFAVGQIAILTSEIKPDGTFVREFNFPALTRSPNHIGRTALRLHETDEGEYSLSRIGISYRVPGLQRAERKHAKPDRRDFKNLRHLTDALAIARSTES